MSPDPIIALGRAFITDQADHDELVDRWSRTLTDRATYGYAEEPHLAEDKTWRWRACLGCLHLSPIKGVGRCAPIPAKGRQRVWEWTP